MTTLDEYEQLPDCMTVSEVHQHCMVILDDAVTDDVSLTLAKLDEMSNRQWHTYELPEATLQTRLREWLIDNWVSPDEAFLESVLGLAFCFGLDKDLFQQALRGYKGQHVGEFQQHLDESNGSSIDPWWSLKNNAQEDGSSVRGKLRP